MTHREKVEFDPLSAFNVSTAAEPTAIPVSTTDAKAGETVDHSDTTIFRTVDTSKVRFKESKKTTTGASAAAAAATPAVSSFVPHSAAKATSSLWDDPPTSPNASLSVDAILSGASSSSSSRLTDSKEEVDLFGLKPTSKAANSSNLDILLGESTAQTTKPPQSSTTNSRPIPTSTLDDANFTGLHTAAKLLQREGEDDLDFETFGKSSAYVAQQKQKEEIEKVHKQANAISKDDLDLFSLDSLAKLEVATKQESRVDLFAPSTGGGSFLDSLGGDAAAEGTANAVPEVDFNNLDAYLAAQGSASSGGLFD